MGYTDATYTHKYGVAPPASIILAQSGELSGIQVPIPSGANLSVLIRQTLEKFGIRRRANTVESGPAIILEEVSRKPRSIRLGLETLERLVRWRPDDGGGDQR
ncbi:unnamed protein product [Rhizoctonia solani]|uniref:Uncharacterized protein n=1 Tax=Rhizoctonia solani TaxID=456999 RepID=A0A8H2XY43_9AGAM|nr:unnamed protein product [Rhizoctonia solani]